MREHWVAGKHTGLKRIPMGCCSVISTQALGPSHLAQPEAAEAVSAVRATLGALRLVPPTSRTTLESILDMPFTANARMLGNAQTDAVQNVTGSFTAIGNSAAVGMLGPGSDGAFQAIGDSKFSDMVPTGVANGRASKATFDASRVARTSQETRPANVALSPRLHV